MSMSGTLGIVTRVSVAPRFQAIALAIPLQWIRVGELLA